ncbi:MAG TPA: HAMP domain-containing sensor histidine kinase [Gemmatimonadaceae bacterium]
MALIVATVATPSSIGRRMISIALVSLLVVILHEFNRRGRTAFASWVLILGLTAIVTQRAWQTGGVHAPVALFYMMIVLMGVGLLRVQGGVVAALACVVSAMLLAGAEVAGWLVVPAPQVSTPTEPLIAAILAVAVTGLCLTLLFRQAEDVATEDLVNMFVHDMRSPLTVVMARLSMLQSEVPHGSELAEHADAAIAEAMRLNRMANNLLDVSRFAGTSLALHRTPSDASKLARNVAHALGALDPSRHIEVRAPVPVMCQCDPEILRRIIENLISNAIKHTARGGHIVVEVSHGSACVRISVEDDGPGVPQNARELIFERYSAKGMLAHNGHHSVGLGLAFCKLATAAHGGRIWVEDAQPRGSRFVVELPE